MVWLVWVDRGTSSFASFSLCRSASAHQIGLPDLIKIQATQLNLNAGETEKKKKERKKERNWYKYIPDIAWNVLILKKIIVDLKFKLIGHPTFNLEAF